jgi:hypothetical protein
LKRFASILFLTIVLFNLYGYHIVISYFQSQDEHSLEARLDHNQYSEDDLIYIKLPLNLPYYNSTSNYERVNGSINVAGIEYKYVKRRVYNDTIELACIPNYNNQKFESVKDEFFKLSNDWQSNHQGKKSIVIQNFTFEYCNKLLHYSLNQLDEQKRSYGISPSTSLIFCFKSVLEQPPENV